MQFKTIFVAVAVALTSVNAIAVPEDVAAIVARDDYTPGVPSMPQAPAAQNVPSVDTMITDVNSATAEQAAQVSCSNYGQYSCSFSRQYVVQCAYTKYGLAWVNIGACWTPPNKPTTQCGFIGNIPYCLN